MTRYVAFLRAVNVGGRGTVAMAGLRSMVEGLGLSRVQTLLQSGNVIFDAASTPEALLEARLQAEAAKRLSVETDFMVRTAAELVAIVASNPFPEAAASDPGHLLVLFAKDPPAAAAVEALQAAIKGRETVRARGRDLYTVYPDGIGRSKLTNALIESKLGTRVTGRNWNTVLKLQALLTA